MRASINGNNGSSKLRLAVVAAETSYLLGGLGAGTPKFKITGSVATGLCIAVDENGKKATISEGNILFEIPTGDVEAIHEPVCQADLLVKFDRDESGPVLKTQPLPAVFVDRPKRALAHKRLEQFQHENPQLVADALFRSSTTVRRTSSVAVAWEFKNIYKGGVIDSRVAKVTCGECEQTAEINQKNIWPEEVLAKKFKEMGWRLKGSKAICPGCQGKPTHAPRVPVDMIGAIDAAIDRRSVAQRTEELKAALAMANALLDDIDDPSLFLRVVKKHAELVRIVKA